MNANVQKKLMTAENIVPDLRNPSVPDDLTSGICMTANPLCRDHGKRYFPVAQAPLRSTMNANVQKKLMATENVVLDLRNLSVLGDLTSGIRITANPLCRDHGKRYFPVAQTPLRSTINANAQKTLMATENVVLDLRNLSVLDGLTSGICITANPLCRDRRKRYFPVAQTPLRSTMNANVQKTLMTAESMMPDLRNLSVLDDLTSGIRMTASPLCRDRRKRYFPDAHSGTAAFHHECQCPKDTDGCRKYVPDLRNPSVKGWPDFRNTHDRKPIMP